jgi:hypothetical protein
MSQQVRCDFCGAQIKPEDENNKLVFNDKEYDLCSGCVNSPIILSEQRRTRTRRPAPKVGRPKGRKNKPAEEKVE